MAEELFDLKKPLYSIDRKTLSLLIHPDWAEYLNENYRIVHSWAMWEWLQYMQARNPNAPAVPKKLFPPPQREQLTQQTNYWRAILEQADLRCIYSRKRLTARRFALDHFLPWSFVAHDQLWNLLPADPSANSAKGNQLPSTRYIEEFIRVQHTGLTVSHHFFSNRRWHNAVESYVADLKLPPEYLLNLDHLSEAYNRALGPLISLASNQGFPTEWRYISPGEDCKPSAKPARRC